MAIRKWIFVLSTDNKHRLTLRDEEVKRYFTMESLILAQDER